MNTVKTKLVNGYEVEMDPASEFIIHEIWDDLFYDRDYRIGDGDVVVDIGANIGIFSLFAAGRGAKVYAVEPDEQNYTLLCANIRRNGLTGQVIPFHTAVAKNDGSIALYIPRADGLCVSGLITTSLAQVEKLTGDNAEVCITRVEAVSLPHLLQQIGEQNISLLKIDTEGAELDIFSGAGKEQLETVERIVMETHAAYAERRLYHLVRNLGFSVCTYEKLSGSFSTGYLFAARPRHKKLSVRTQPVAVLDVPGFVVLPKEIIADAGQSFSTVTETEDTLGYRFGVDGEVGEFTTEPLCRFRVAGPGPHRISVEVLEGGIGSTRQKDMPAGFTSDHSEKTVWVFAEHYGPSATAAALPVLGEKYEFTVSGTADFVVPASCIPKQWDYSALGLGISLLDANRKAEIPQTGLVFNGNRAALDKAYQEILFPAFPKQSDLCFSCETEGKVRICLYWFAKDGAEKAALPQLDCRRKARRLLGEKSLAHICLFEGAGRLVIPRELLPKTWNPVCVKICFSVHESDTAGRELEGEVTFKGRCFGLQGWYKEIHLSGEDIKDSMEFSLRVPRSRNYQVTWWPE